MVDLTAEDFEAAVECGRDLTLQPRAVSAHFDVERNRVIIRLTTGIEIGFAPHIVQGLDKATDGQMSVIEVRENGLGIHFPRLDADLYVPALLDGWLGTRRWSGAIVAA